jgi:hypothetical protein
MSNAIIGGIGGGGNTGIGVSGEKKRDERHGAIGDAWYVIPRETMNAIVDLLLKSKEDNMLSVTHNMDDPEQPVAKRKRPDDIKRQQKEQGFPYPPRKRAAGPNTAASAAAAATGDQRKKQRCSECVQKNRLCNYHRKKMFE